MITATRKVKFARRPDKSRAIVPALDTAEAAPAGRVPRISRLMALAIHFDRLIREGKVRDQSELARLVHVTQPRMTQIMNLNLLAPAIQEDLLCRPRTVAGHDRIGERLLRPVVREPDWRQQSRHWMRILTALPDGCDSPRASFDATTAARQDE